MVAHLDLAISLHDSTTGDLLESKRRRTDRSFDEHNAWATYAQFISKPSYAAGDARNLAGFKRLQNTRSIVISSHIADLIIWFPGDSNSDLPNQGLAVAAESQLQKFIDGEPGGYVDVSIWCSDEGLYSTTSPDGRTYEEGPWIPRSIL